MSAHILFPRDKQQGQQGMPMQVAQDGVWEVGGSTWSDPSNLIWGPRGFNSGTWGAGSLGCRWSMAPEISQCQPPPPALYCKSATW